MNFALDLGSCSPGSQRPFSCASFCRGVRNCLVKHSFSMCLNMTGSTCVPSDGKQICVFWVSKTQKFLASQGRRLRPARPCASRPARPGFHCSACFCSALWGSPSATVVLLSARAEVERIRLPSSGIRRTIPLMSQHSRVTAACRLPHSQSRFSISRAAAGCAVTRSLSRVGRRRRTTAD